MPLDGNEDRDAEKYHRGQIGKLKSDPYGYVMYNFRWGAKGTTLERSKGPRNWQKGWLLEWGEEIRGRNFDGHTPVAPIRSSTVSGHGIGKSALTAMAAKFIHDTRPHSKGTITASTDTQLKTKTWAEIGKWHKLSLTESWSDYSASRGNMSLVNVTSPEDWRVDAQTCRKENSEAFAGQHSETSTSFYIFDEASAVPDEIYEVARGGLTDGEPMWFLFGNGTRNRGSFYNSHHRERMRWIRHQIDSREINEVNKELLQEYIDDYGLDSDFVRVRVLGQFPKASSLQFIETDSIEMCMGNEDDRYPAQPESPVILGVDVAREGDDRSVIQVKRGRDARNWGCWEYNELRTTELAAIVGSKANELQADAVFVDGGGVGGGVVDKLIELNIPNVHEINFASNAPDRKYANMRSYMYGELRQGLRAGMLIDNDDDLKEEIQAVEYGFNRQNQIQLEPKEKMKKLIGLSPDRADALALCFAMPVGPRGEWQQGDTQSRPPNMVTDHTET